MKKINKSKRADIKIPEGSKVYKYLFETNENSKHAKWELLEQLVEQTPKTRAEQAGKILSDALTELTILYPETKDKWPLIKAYIYKQILGIELNEFGYEELKKKRKLDDAMFEELKNL